MAQGLALANGEMHVLIPVATPYPIKKTQTYTNPLNNMNKMQLQLFQGDSKVAKENDLIGDFILEIPRAPKNTLKINVTFEIDGDGILKVTAEETASGANKSCTVQAKGALTDAEREAMRERARIEEEENKKADELLLCKNDLETLVFAVKTCKDGDKVSAADKEVLEVLYNENENWLTENPNST